MKVHGGATALQMGYATKDETVSVRKDMNMEEKQRIARYAAELIEKNDFVYIDAGTTTGCLMEWISEKGAVFVTNGIVHARTLAEKGYKVFLLGGELKAATEAVVGGETIESLKRYHFTKGFFGTNGVHEEAGFTTPDINEAFVKEQAMKQCRECYILTDSSKIGKISPVRFGTFHEATVITTDLQDVRLKKYKNIMEVK